jgi:gamma-glutamyl-gamma-aminobutyrate hydrolase PuuD
MPYSTPSAKIAISYRDDGNGKGPFFDHHTVQRATEHETSIVKADNVKTSSLDSEIKQSPLCLEQSSKNRDGKKSPKTEKLEDCGLLYIPGRPNETSKSRQETHQQRANFEHELIKQAMLRGQPIMAVCAGSWQLWQTIDKNSKLKNVSGHNCGNGMPRICKNGNVGFNIIMHDIEVDPNTVLGAIFKATDTNKLFPVNSVHWKAPDDTYIPSNIQICARAKQIAESTRKNRQGNIEMPDEETIEAFESIFGAPILGILWHAEAFNKDDDASKCSDKQQNILLFMAKAGDAYQAKRRMLIEFTDKQDDICKGLKTLKI